MLELAQSFLKFATFGVTCEVVYTAVTQLIADKRANRKAELSLRGQSYIWMIPIYGMVAFLGPLLVGPLQAVPYLIRLLIYTAIIFTVEYIAGWILKKITGRCPWHYEHGRHVHHLINLSMTPLWMLFAAMAEFLYLNY